MFMYKSNPFYIQIDRRYMPESIKPVTKAPVIKTPASETNKPSYTQVLYVYISKLTIIRCSNDSFVSNYR